MTAGVEFRPATWEIDAPAATALVMPVAFTLDGNDYPWGGVEIVARVLDQRTRAPLATMTVDDSADGQLVLSLTADQVSALGAARFVWHLDIDAVPVLAGRFQVHPEGSPFPARRTGPTVQVSTGGIEATVVLGLAASLTIGDVDTLDPDEEATATLTGSPTARVLNLGIPAGSPGDWASAQPVNAQTAAYTLLAADIGRLVTVNTAGAVDVTVPAGLGMIAGQRIDLLSVGVGQVTLVASGATVNGTPTLKLRARYSAATLLCVGADDYVLVGDLAAF